MKLFAILALLGATSAVKLAKINTDDLKELASEINLEDVTIEDLEEVKALAKEHWDDLSADAKAALKELEAQAKAHFAAQSRDAPTVEDIKEFVNNADLENLTEEDVQAVKAAAEEHWDELSDDVKAALNEAKAHLKEHFSAAQKPDKQLAKLKKFVSKVNASDVTVEDLENAKELAKANWASLSDDVKAALKEAESIVKEELAAQKGDKQLAKLKKFASKVKASDVTVEDLENAKELAKANWASLSDDVKAALKEAESIVKEEVAAQRGRPERDDEPEGDDERPVKKASKAAVKKGALQIVADKLEDVDWEAVKEHAVEQYEAFKAANPELEETLEEFEEHVEENVPETLEEVEELLAHWEEFKSEMPDLAKEIEKVVRPHIEDFLADHGVTEEEFEEELEEE